MKDAQQQLDAEMTSAKPVSRKQLKKTVRKSDGEGFSFLNLLHFKHR